MMPGFMAQRTARVYCRPQLNRLGDSSGRIFGAMEQQAFADRVPPAGRLRAAAVAGLRALVDLVLPPQCLACTRPVGVEGGLCPACWSRLRLIERPYCARLGTPFAYDLGEGALSAEAIADPPPFERCRAVAAFDDVARNLVHGLKYRGAVAELCHL